MLSTGSCKGGLAKDDPGGGGGGERWLRCNDLSTKLIVCLIAWIEDPEME